MENGSVSTEKRKLAAVMFTDIKGFSKRMGEDEEGTFKLLKQQMSELKPIIQKYDGRVVKTIGDAIMGDFASVQNAVKCATEIQKLLYRTNKSRTEQEKLIIRIGIHLGDVIMSDNDLFGDGVNIAARLEGNAPPGGIAISEIVYNSVKNQLPLNYKDIGPQSLKNIKEPVNVFHIPPIEDAMRKETTAEEAVEAEKKEEVEISEPTMKFKQHLESLEIDEAKKCAKTEKLSDNVVKSLVKQSIEDLGKKQEYRKALKVGNAFGASKPELYFAITGEFQKLYKGGNFEEAAMWGLEYKLPKDDLIPAVQKYFSDLIGKNASIGEFQKFLDNFGSMKNELRDVAMREFKNLYSMERFDLCIYLGKQFGVMGKEVSEIAVKALIQELDKSNFSRVESLIKEYNVFSANIFQPIENENTKKKLGNLFLDKYVVPKLKKGEFEDLKNKLQSFNFFKVKFYDKFLNAIQDEIIGNAVSMHNRLIENDNYKIAKILNKHFISIKVDREERPDLDDIYMTAVVAITGSGGWPMTVFLTPELKPFYGGTYFPPEDKWGRVGFKNLILRLNDFWQNDQSRIKLIQDAETLSQIVDQRASLSLPIDEETQLSRDLIANATRQLEAAFDAKWGGFSNAPKFPPSNAVSFLLRDFYHTGNKRSLHMATFTLDKMFEGGMYDHLGGGFHRYSVDPHWLVPHFEKMLYDNAQLAIVYIEAFLATGNKKYARIAQEIFDYEMTYMTGDSGEIFSTEDADSEGKEGLFYLWKRDELDKILGRKEAGILSRYYNVKNSGNFSSHEDYHKGFNILHIRNDVSTVANELGMTEKQLMDMLTGLKHKLLEVRDKRVRPGLDDKIITSWNALMISAFARGYQVFADKRYLDAAENAATFIADKMRTKEGKLLRIYRAGESKFHAYLEDYAYTIRAFIDLFEAGFAERWLFMAEDLTAEMVAQFWDEKSASFFNTSQYHKNLIVRTKSANDSATPSPMGVAIESLLRLAKLLDREEYFHKAQRLLKANLPYLEKAPQGYLTLAMNVDFLIHPPKEIAIVGQKDSEETKKLLKTIHSRYIPNRIIALLDPESKNAEELAKKVPLLSGRELIDGKATAYVCENFICQLPVTSPDELVKQLVVQ